MLEDHKRTGAYYQVGANMTSWEGGSAGDVVGERRGVPLWYIWSLGVHVHGLGSRLRGRTHQSMLEFIVGTATRENSGVRMYVRCGLSNQPVSRLFLGEASSKLKGSGSEHPGSPNTYRPESGRGSCGAGGGVSPTVPRPRSPSGAGCRAGPKVRHLPNPIS
jgi:hypothetical protein